jgi:hypothetical protein
MEFWIHNLKLKTWNNSCEFVFDVELKWYTITLIHLKHNTKQNKDKNNYNNNEHKQNTVEGKNSLLRGVSIWFLQVEAKIYHPGPSTFILNIWNNIQQFDK